MLKKLTLALSIAAASFSAVAVAETVNTPAGDLDVTMNAGLFSDYIYRGVSQTQGKAAIQGGLDIAHESGLYTGVWASNVDFGPASDASTEFDYKLGFKGDLTDDVSYDLGWVKYDYPDASALDFSEYYGNLTAYDVTLGLAYSNDFAKDNSTLYSSIGYVYTLPLEIGLSLRYGHYDFKDATFASGDESYNDWSIGLSKTCMGLNFGVTYTDTSLSSTDAAGFAGKKDYADGNLTLSVSKTL